MNSGNNSLALLSCEITEQFANGSSFEGIETGSRFVQHDEGGIRDELDTDRYTLALTTRQHLSVDTTNLRVHDVIETQFFNDLRYECVLFFVSRREF